MNNPNTALVVFCALLGAITLVSVNEMIDLDDWRPQSTAPVEVAEPDLAPAGTPADAASTRPDAEPEQDAEPVQQAAAPDTAPAPPAATPDAAAEPDMQQAAGDDQASDPAAEPPVPQFDLVRAEPDGSLVIAGNGPVGAEIEVIAGADTVATAAAGPNGDFAAVLDEPLKPGDYQIVLRATAPDGVVVTSRQTAVVAIPEAGSQDVLALVEEPGAPSRLITTPQAGATAMVPAATGDEPTVEPAMDDVAAPSVADGRVDDADRAGRAVASGGPETVVEPDAIVAAGAAAEDGEGATVTPSPMADATAEIASEDGREPDTGPVADAAAVGEAAQQDQQGQSEQDAPQVAAGDVAVAAAEDTMPERVIETEGSVAAAFEQDAAEAAPDMATAEQDGQGTEGMDADGTVPDTPPASSQAAPAVGSDGDDATEIASLPQPADNATVQAPAPAAPAAMPDQDAFDLRIEAVEIDGIEVFVAGAAAPGTRLLVYANEILLGDTTASEVGRFLVQARRDLPVGDYIIRADAIDPGTADVLRRASVPFVRGAGERVAAVAAPAASAPEATEATEPAAAPASPALAQPRSAEEPPTLQAPGDETVVASLPAEAAQVEQEPAPVNDAMAETATEPEAEVAPSADAAATRTTDGPASAAPEQAAVATEDEEPAAAPADEVASLAEEPSAATTASPDEDAPAEPAAQVAPAAGEDAVADSAAVAEAASADAMVPVEGSVIIRRGDTLWQISRRVYGRGVKYTTIYLANQDQISDPGRIWPGQVFQVPDDADEDAEQTHRELRSQRR